MRVGSDVGVDNLRKSNIIIYIYIVHTLVRA